MDRFDLMLSEHDVAIPSIIHSLTTTAVTLCTLLLFGVVLRSLCKREKAAEKVARLSAVGRYEEAAKVGVQSMVFVGYPRTPLERSIAAMVVARNVVLLSTIERSQECCNGVIGRYLSQWHEMNSELEEIVGRWTSECTTREEDGDAATWMERVRNLQRQRDECLTVLSSRG